MLLPKIWIICRVCLQQKEDMYNLFGDTLSKNTWELLRDCGGVPVRKNDDLPDRICDGCLKRLSEAVNFRIDCQRGHRELGLKLLNRNDIMHDEDIFSEFLITDNPTKSPNNSVAKEQTKFSTNINETAINDNESIIINTNSNNVIKQYCIVKKEDIHDTNLGNENNSEEKMPIVLLLRLKDISSEKSNTETNKTEEETSKISELKTNEQTATNLLNETVTKEKTKRKYITKREAKSKLKKKEENSTCKLCKKTYKTKELLRHHMYVHQRPYQCKICHKRFSQNHSFISHNNWHTGIKPYYCRICYQTFSDIANRNTHESTNHENQEFKCDKCDKVFRFLSFLKKHAQSHRPKKCFICNKDFVSLQMVRKHHQRKHLKECS